MIEWKKTAFESQETKWITTYRNKKLGIQKEVIVYKTHDGRGIGKTDTFYYIDGINQEYKTEETLQHFLSVIKPKHGNYI